MRKKPTAVITALALMLALTQAACELNVSDPISTGPILVPYISIHPASYSYSVDAYQAPPELSVEVWDWNKMDGAISYQWHTFTTLEQYYKGQATPISGATGTKYTPGALTTSAGARNYFYVAVTNTNKYAGGGKKSAVLQSEVSIISFSAAGDPAIPVLSSHPSNAQYQFGRSAALAPLEVRASVSGTNSFLSYQWYSFDGASFTDGKPNGAPIEGATQRNFLPSLDDMNPGDNYYYVVVTNSLTNPNGDTIGSSSEYSMPAKINMALGEKAEAPRIERQPADFLFLLGDAGAPSLTVAAESIDRGTLSYQWFSTTANASGVPQNTGGTPVGADSATLTPPISTTAAGTAYYYVVVTNTNPLVTGATTAALTSKPATVRVRSAASVTPNATAVINPNERFNYVRGYGGMDVAWANFPETYEADTEKMYNPDILGFNILRIMISPKSSDIDYTMRWLTEGVVEDGVAGGGFRSDYYKNVQIVNKYGGYVLASPWSPPKEWKSNNSINSGGHLIKAYYKQYANYLRNFARHMYYKGAPIYAISIQNEPNYAGGYDGCEWEPEEMRDFFIEVGHFTDGVRGWGGGRQTPVVLTMNGESANTPNINKAALDDPRSNAVIDLLARHVYGEQRVTLWDYPNRRGKEVWMTEHNINSASSTAFPNDWTWNYIWRFMNDVDLVMRLNNENAFVWWAGKRFYSYIGDNEANTVDGAILPRGYGLSHYAKVTIDTTRIGVSVTGTTGGGAAITQGTASANVNSSAFDVDNLSAKITAYISQDGSEISMVMWTPTQNTGAGGVDMGTVKIDLPADFTIRSATALRSKGVAGEWNTGNTSECHVVDDVLVSQDRKSAYVTLPRSEILSVKFVKQ